MKKLLAPVLFVAIVLGINYGSGILIGRYIRTRINESAPAVRGARLTVQRVFVNPALLRIYFNGVSVSAPTGWISETLFRADSIAVDCELLPIFFRKLIVEELSVKKFSLSVEFYKEKTAIPLPGYFAYQRDRLSKEITGLLTPAIRSRRHKYPPTTLENVRCADGTIKFLNMAQSPPGVFEWENCILEIPEFWQSMDRTQTRIRYSIRAYAAGGTGMFEWKGTYTKNLQGISNEGSALLTNFDLARLAAFNRALIPARSIAGKLDIECDPGIQNNSLNAPLTILFRGLAIGFLPEQKKIFGISVEILRSMLASTQGNFSVSTTVTGDIRKPRVDTQDIATQLIKQALMKSQEKNITQKAKKYGSYLNNKIKKKLQGPK